ncbi:MAG: 50S ribosomal protein L10 [Deltaproteobacteria bacterium]|nr:50S ribosomal protein L10 [Deltaproteobacteria bacterium]MBW2492436.1 50S ribosomal protein L10 [Deltaproteobacteria bacterium]
MRIEKKKEIVKDLHEKFLRSKVVILTDYKGLDVTTINDLRRRLGAEEIEYKVVKNSLLIRASEETDIALIKDYFKGPSAIALSYDDPIAPAKVLTKFSEEHKQLEIKTGVMDGRVLDMGAIKRISALPGREELLGQFLSVANGVVTGFVRVLNAVPAQFLNVLQAIKEQKEAG